MAYDLKNHFVNSAPWRTASVYEDLKTETIAVEYTSDGQLVLTEYYGASPESMTLASMEALTWVRYGTTPPTTH